MHEESPLSSCELEFSSASISMFLRNDARVNSPYRSRSQFLRARSSEEVPSREFLCGNRHDWPTSRVVSYSQEVSRNMCCLRIIVSLGE